MNTLTSAHRSDAAALPSTGQAQAATVGVAIAQMLAFQNGNRILFQGDSITDGNRGRDADPNHILGHGYVFIIAAKYSAQFPERNLEFFNRGISGNVVSDLSGRWKEDTLDLKPDILSILIGVNDAGAGVPIEEYEATYDKMLLDTVTALPNVRLVLCEPFTLPGDEHRDNWASWRANVGARCDVVATLAAKYHAPVAHFQKALEDATLRASPKYWIWDTVHPTYAGHQLLADEWLKTVASWKFTPRPAL